MWGHATRCYCWSQGSDSCYHQLHHLEACCRWKFNARQIHRGSSEDHTSLRQCFVQDGLTGSFHKCSGLDGGDEESVWNEGWAENHQQPALVPWLLCLSTHKEAVADCQPSLPPLGVGTEVAEPDNGPIGNMSSSVTSPDSNFAR